MIHHCCWCSVSKSGLSLCDPMDCSLPGSSVYGILQARKTPVFLGFPCGSAGKESACNAGDLGSILGLGRDSLEKGNATPLQYSGLENSVDYTVRGVAKSRTQLSNFHFTSTFRQEYWSRLHFLLQGIFLTQGLNPGLLLGGQILYC